eukprot:CAMPEP_0204519842 /NCGR_PEP_ID=MMETSP0661-20131031/4945_1 /ASSEMBLY_ACC=CAM_ASM_000606 /TAXON_ID=109239 /ORGANISM="Alexandrium margalefi, Strain AMGDE01CS-322" /LENGTH=350 /DNA_ID=CAMNT_0051525363 /DNA_START=130 /DNA_END=1183 /DNA_ORIENTATION=-
MTTKGEHKLIRLPGSLCFVDHEGELIYVEVHKPLLLVNGVASKVLADGDMPVRAPLLVEVFLDLLGHFLTFPFDLPELLKAAWDVLTASSSMSSGMSAGHLMRAPRPRRRTPHPASRLGSLAGMLQPVPQTMTVDGKAVGARVPPHVLSILCAPACAISGYEHGDLMEGCCQGKACVANFLNCICCFLGSFFALASWKPDPNRIKGDGTQRKVEDKCYAACCAGGIQTVAFWESGDMCCTPDGSCTWFYGDALIAVAFCIIPLLVTIGPLDCCYACCCWSPNPMNFKRSTRNHGGGQPIVGAPVQTAISYMAFKDAARAAPAPQFIGQPAMQAQVVQAQPIQAPLVGNNK